MEQNNKFEVFSNLTKKDTIVALDENILPGSLVFDSLNAFPGYYHDTPENARPIYLYLVLDKQYPLEEILRATQNIEKEYDWNFDAGKGYLQVGSEFLNVIRLRHLPTLEMVARIQDAYMKQGIGFLMNKRIKGLLEAQVKIVKFLHLEKVGDGIYIDWHEPEFGYIEIPKYLSWPAFVKVSMDVKYNWMASEFDAASCSFFRDGKLIEVVRILSTKTSKSVLADIRKLYIEKIR
jgi:hypothetical protein